MNSSDFKDKSDTARHLVVSGGISRLRLLYQYAPAQPDRLERVSRTLFIPQLFLFHLVVGERYR